RCRSCTGPMIQERSNEAPRCTWCGSFDASWSCSHCSSTRLRAPVVGNVRTAEEFAQAFPERLIVTSHGGSAVSQITETDALVLATPGAEPHAQAVGGY